MVVILLIFQNAHSERSVHTDFEGNKKVAYERFSTDEGPRLQSLETISQTLHFLFMFHVDSITEHFPGIQTAAQIGAFRLRND